ncbi:MAG: T9SS type A sorting domain-containing protein, partial [Candidatus Marinimicrobia bacterium]|nr:T9SS type A sorting domain-containing protein [Candidatus Neomarinimicrobiota bacterium]
WNYTWESDDAGFLPGQEQPTVSLRMFLRDGPTDNDTSIVYLGYSFTIDNDQGQTIEMVPFPDEQADSVLISFTINDATNDTLDLTFEYSVDPGAWDVISLTGDTSNINSNGSVTWLSMADLPGLESYDVQLRAVAHDGWGAGAYDTVTVHLDNNQPPQADFVSTYEEEHNEIPIIVSIDDAENDTVNIAYEYSANGSDWSPIYDTTLAEADYSGIDWVYSWQSQNNISDIQEDNVFIRIITSDGAEAQDNTITQLETSFVLDNDQNQTVDLFLSAAEEYSGNTDVTFSINDPTADLHSLLLFYRSDTTDWETVTLLDTLGVMGLDPENYNGTFTWQSALDLPHMDVNAHLKVIAEDNWGPGPETELSNIPVDNENGPQLVSDPTVQIYPHPDNSIILAFELPIDPLTVDTANIFMTDLPGVELEQISDTLIKVTRENGYPANSQISLNITHNLRDILGKPFDGNSDGDPSEEADDYIVIVNTDHLADFNSNGQIGTSDLDAFISGWYANDPLYETAPVKTTYENGADSAQFILKPDNIFDIDDLMTFVRMWNYCENNDCLEGSILLARGTADVGMLTSSYDGTNLSLGFSQGQIPDVAEFTLEYNNETVTLGRAFSDTLRAKPEKSILFEKNTQDPKLRNQVLGYLESMDEADDTPWFIHFPFEMQGKDLENIIVHYAYNVNGQEVLGRKEISVAPIPDEFALFQNYPNPFNPVTTIEYAIPEAVHVNIVIYDIMGRQVKTLLNELQEPGYRSIRWSSTNDAGELVATGVYFYMISAGQHHSVKKMLLIK